MTGMALAGGGDAGSTSLQLATIIALQAGTWVGQIDGGDTPFSLVVDADPGRHPAIGDRVLVTRQGSQMYEVAVVSSTYVPGPSTTPYAFYGLAADQAIGTGAITKLLVTVDVDGSRTGLAAPIIGAFTIPANQQGVWDIHCQVGWPASATATRRITHIFVNGTEAVRNEKSSPTSGIWDQACHASLRLNAGDTVDFRCFQNSGASVSCRAFVASPLPATWITMTKTG